MENRLAVYLWETIRKPLQDYPFSIWIEGLPLNYFGQGEVREESNRLWEKFRSAVDAALYSRQRRVFVVTSVLFACPVSCFSPLQK
jgi:hypothetical protein